MKNGLGRNVNETVVLNGGFYFMFSSAQSPSNDSLKYPSKILSSDAGRTFCFHSRNSLPPSCPEQYTNLAFVFCSASQMWLSEERTRTPTIPIKLASATNCFHRSLCPITNDMPDVVAL